jgi:hypothetical protein
MNIAELIKIFKAMAMPLDKILDLYNGTIEVENSNFIFNREELENYLTWDEMHEYFIISRRKSLKGRYFTEDERENILLNLSDEKAEDKITNIKLLIDNVQTRIDISIWEEEYSDLKDFFASAINRGIKIKGLYFGYENKLDDVFVHRRLETYLKEKDERYIILIFDQKEAITGIISRGENSQITWTNDYGVIDIMEDYIVHDLMINEYSSSLSDLERQKYEFAMDKVRKNFFKE